MKKGLKLWVPNDEPSHPQHPTTGSEIRRWKGTQTRQSGWQGRGRGQCLDVGGRNSQCDSQLQKLSRSSRPEDSGKWSVESMAPKTQSRRWKGAATVGRSTWPQGGESEEGWVESWWGSRILPLQKERDVCGQVVFSWILTNEEANLSCIHGGAWCLCLWLECLLGGVCCLQWQGCGHLSTGRASSLWWTLAGNICLLHPRPQDDRLLGGELRSRGCLWSSEAHSSSADVFKTAKGAGEF